MTLPVAAPVAVLASEEAVRELPIPTWSFGVIALFVFLLLLGLTWSFRGTAQKYARPDLTGQRPDSPVGPDGDAGAEVDRAHWPERPEHRN
ncbi:MAG: hypothetical protein ACRCY8_11610 [Dermatophilaceae bacterium]